MLVKKIKITIIGLDNDNDENVTLNSRVLHSFSALLNIVQYWLMLCDLLLVNFQFTFTDVIYCDICSD